jgi:hypothetical protein
MPLLYHNPATVANPKNFIRKVDVLYDGKEDGFSLAMLDWEGVPHIGIRWNVAAKELSDTEKQSGKLICNGSPSSKGIPSWFILPRELFNPDLFDKDSETFLKLVAGWNDDQAKAVPPANGE